MNKNKNKKNSPSKSKGSPKLRVVTKPRKLSSKQLIKTSLLLVVLLVVLAVVYVNSNKSSKNSYISRIKSSSDMLSFSNEDYAAFCNEFISLDPNSHEYNSFAQRLSLSEASIQNIYKSCSSLGSRDEKYKSNIAEMKNKASYFFFDAYDTSLDIDGL
jgi:hypothetical protein